MEILFLLLYPLTFAALWYLLSGVLKKVFKENYKTRYALIAFVVFLPLIVVALGYAAVIFLPFAGD